MVPSNGNCGVSLFSSTNFTGVTQTEKVKVQSGCCERSAGCGHFVERAGIAGGGMEGRNSRREMGGRMFGKEGRGTASGQSKPMQGFPLTLLHNSPLSLSLLNKRSSVSITLTVIFRYCIACPIACCPSLPLYNLNTLTNV